MHPVASREDTQVDVLAPNVTEDDTRDDNGRQGNSVGDLLHDRTGRAQGRRADAITGIVVGHGGDDDVDDNVKDLQEGESFGEVAGVLQFSHDTEVRDVTDYCMLERFLPLLWRFRLTVCENNVGDGGKGFDQVGLDNGLDGHATGMLDAKADHTDDDSSSDTGEGSHGQP